MLKNLLVSVIVLLPILLAAQQVPQYSLYALNPYAYNPAYAGMGNSLEATGVFRKQWSGLDGSPTTQNFNFHLPINYLSSGIGMNIENDVVGAIRTTSISAGYSYKMSLGKKTKLSLGLSGGMVQSSLDGSKLLAPEGEYDGNLPTHNDNLLPETKINAISYRLGTGIYVKTTTLDAGISVLHLTGSKIDYSFNDVTDFNFLRHYIGFLAYKFELGNKISLRPSIMAKTDLIQSQMDVTAVMEYDEKYLIGAAYRGYSKHTTDAISIIGGMKITRNWRLGYAYDFSLSGLKTVNQGSHEIMLRYELGRTIGNAKLPKIIHNPRLL